MEAGEVATRVALLVLSMGGTYWHISRERAGRFWAYYARLFGRAGWVTDRTGNRLFVGLEVAQYALAVLGYLLGLPLFRGAVLGARSADCVLSHWFLRARFPAEPNPGLWSTGVYVVEGALSVLLMPVWSLLYLTGFALGAGAFAGFWAVSFALKR